jgi:excisionase family DNA binding protein
LEAQTRNFEPAGDTGGLMSVRELSRYLSVSRTFAFKLVADGTIPSFKLGQLRRMRKADVDCYIQSRLSTSEKD